VELPRPEVTVTDPRQPGVLVAVEEPPAPQLGRRGAALLGAVALVVAVALFAADVARSRRLDGVADVVLGAPPGGWSAAHEPGTRTGTVAGAVRLLNRGPRDVRVTSASLGALRARDAPTLPAGGDGELWLQRSVRCPADGSPPPPEPEVRELRLAVEAPGGREAVVLEGSGLPAGSLDDSVQARVPAPAAAGGRAAHQHRRRGAGAHRRPAGRTSATPGGCPCACCRSSRRGAWSWSR
jgi:hypothetical protein